MKNRGVEIFMCPLEEISNYDIYSLLVEQGIKDKIIIHKLIDIHRIMKNLVTGVTISINHLLRTAYSVSQNMNGKKPIIEAIRDICIDTYVHYLNGNSKQNALLEIDRILEENSGTSNEFWFPNLNTIDILQSANFSFIKQQCNVLEQYKYICETNIEDLLLSFFGRSSSSDIAIRSRLVSNRLKFSNQAIKKFIQLPPSLDFNKLQFATKSVNLIDHKDLPYDFRYLPDIYFNNGEPYSKKIPHAENKIHLILEYAFNKCLDEPFRLTKINKKSMLITLLSIFSYSLVCFYRNYDFKWWYIV